MTVGIIAAVSPRGVIGVGGKLPWHYPADLKRFRRVTTGAAIVMGRRTWESLPKKPLPGRRNIVITRRPIEGVECFDGVEAALAACAGEDVWFIGGARLFREALRHAEVIDLTYVPDDVESQDAVYFPEIDPDVWEPGPRETVPEDPRLTHQRFWRKRSEAARG